MEEVKATRAVKEISKPYMKAIQIDYQRELLALAKLSKVILFFFYKSDE
jgi:hypothetical protein